jgi:LuxR family maltose regulon positive regulatory protein
MENLLLQTKLNIPVTRGNVVIRQRLIEQLNEELIEQEGFARRLTLISAPAGYGKTTAVIKWLAGLEPEVLWLSLDEEDNDPVRFMAYLVAAFQQADADIGIRSLEMLQSPQPPQVEAFSTLLINDLARNPSPLILALDDYHFIQNPMIHQLVGFLLEHQPAHLHQVILTREDPLLPVSRLLSRGQARELRQDDLRFTADETTDFLKRTMGLKLAEEDISALQRRTEGWIAGLQLAALSMQGQADVHNFIEYFSGSNRYILDYLFEEVFTQQSTEVQEFLMWTSILNQLTIDLCDYIVERSDSRKLLESLERANLFILPMDPAREWYRYHRLFRDLLRHRLHLHQGGNEAQLHLRACDWYQAQGFQADAVQHALAGGDWDRAGKLVLGLSEALMKEGKIVTLLGWFRQFPDSFIRANPELALDYIWTLILIGQNELAGNLLDHVENSTEDDPKYLDSIISARAYLARAKGDVPGTIEYSQRALELVPESNASLRSILAINLGVTYWHIGQMEEASRALDEARRTAQETGNYYALLAALIFLGRVEAVKGDLRKAEEKFRQAIKYEKSAPLTGLAYIDLGALQYEWNDFNASRKNLLKGVEINEASGNVEYQVAGYMLLARLESVLGNTESVNECLRKLQELEGSGEILTHFTGSLV